VDKQLQKIINGIADKLPVVMQHTSELHHVLGEDLIEQGHTVLTNGEKVVPGKKYQQHMPVMLAVNHRRKLKKAFELNGGDGIAAYIAEVNKMIDARISQIKTAPETKSIFSIIKDFLWKTLNMMTRKAAKKNLRVVR
jgi:hypothetical protein